MYVGVRKDEGGGGGGGEVEEMCPTDFFLTLRIILTTKNASMLIRSMTANQLA